MGRDGAIFLSRWRYCQFFPCANPLLYGLLIVLGVIAFSTGEVILSIQVDYIATHVGGHLNSGTIFLALFHWWRLAGYLRPTPSTASYSSTFNFAAVWLVNSVIAAAPGASHCIDIIYPERWLILARFAVYPLCMMPYKAGGRINGTAVR